MLEVARGVWQMPGVVARLINVYLAGDHLIDGGTRWHAPFLAQHLRGRKLSGVILTHAHPDHQGAAHYFCKKHDAPLACHEADVAATDGSGPFLPRNFIVNVLGRLVSGPPHPVGRVLRDGDEIAGFRVVHAPGHTPGHIVLFRESDRLAIAGDLLANMSFVTFRPGLRLPPKIFCTNARQNAESVLKLAALNPSRVLFGHGPPLSETSRLHSFAERLRRRLEA